MIIEKMTGSMEGKEWCLKALHPADPMTEIRGIPDQSAMPSTFLNWQMTSVITPPDLQYQWDAEIAIVPDPCCFAAVATENILGPHDTYSVINSQLGATYPEAQQALVDGFERWRLAYMSVTIEQDAPALSDQGTVVGAIVPVEPSFVSYGYADVASTPGTSTFWSGMRGIYYNVPEDQPNYESIIQMPNAYLGKSKDGIYMPLKLTPNHQKWHSTADNCADFTNQPRDQLGNGRTIQQHVHGAPNVPGAGYPYWGDTTSYVMLDGSTPPLYEGLVEKFRCMPCNDNWGHIVFKSVSPTAKLIMTFRVGFECQCLPSSAFSPYLRLSPAYDPASVETYFKIARELKDAYPAEYNSSDRLWEVIKSVAQKIIPFVSGLGLPGAIAGAIGSAGVALGDVITGSMARKKAAKQGGDRPPAAQVEAAREERKYQIMSKAVATRQPQKRRPRRRGPVSK